MGKKLEEIAEELKKLKKLEEIAEYLKKSKKKVQIIYGFNGVGKTRLSGEFKKLISEKNNNEESEETKVKLLYYNAFTEDLFYWDNDLDEGINRKLIIRPNGFTDWVFKTQGQDQNIITNFEKFSENKITPKFSSEFSEVEFFFKKEDENENVKISKGEESNFIWSIFYIFIKEAIDELNKTESERDDNNPFSDLKYIFIDDPVTSLDENHLIELAVNLAELIQSSKSNELKFIISTHSPLFYNVLYSELNNKTSYMLNKLEDNTFELLEKSGASNKSFSYHHYLINILRAAIDNNKIEKYHFTLLRNLYEKASNFLGYEKWSELLPDDKKLYEKAIMNFYSHSSLSSEQIAEPKTQEKQTVKLLFNHLINNSKFWQKEEKKEENNES